MSEALQAQTSAEEGPETEEGTEAAVAAENAAASESELEGNPEAGEKEEVSDEEFTKLAAKATGKKKKPKAAKKPKKAAKEKKPLAPKLVPNKLGAGAPGIGHNSGQLIQPLVDLMDEDLKIDEQKKNLGKAQRDIRNRVKTEFGIVSAVWQREKQLRKLDPDVRIQVESGHHDLKVALGFQFAMDLKADSVARTEEEYADPSNKLSADQLAAQAAEETEE